jgi:excisionase family DNA binding protein
MNDVAFQSLQRFIDGFNPYASIKDLSAFLKIPYGTIQTWVATGKIPCTKIAGQDPKIYLKDLQTFVKGGVLSCKVCDKRLICDNAATDDDKRWVCPDGCEGATGEEK